MSFNHLAHFGNTANNAFYNSELLGLGRGNVWSWTRHAFSDPNWELIDEHLEDGFDVNQPQWTRYESANTNLVHYPRLASDLNPNHPIRPFLNSITAIAAKAGLHRELAALKKVIAKSLMPNLDKLAQPIGDSGQIDLRKPSIRFFYGSDWPPEICTPAHVNVFLEHGTLRWALDGNPNQSDHRTKYKELVKKSDFLLVTNLDLRTLEAAEELASGRWAAIPHPYILAQELPETNFQLRTELLRKTNSELLIAMPSSINVQPQHDKGTWAALEAFHALRESGLPVGLALTEWGNDLGLVKSEIHARGLEPYVHWSRPLPLRRLRELLLASDLAWDQFGLDAFGALNLKISELGIPLVSRGVRPEVEALIGELPKYLSASGVESIVEKSSIVLTASALHGLDWSRKKFGLPQKNWLNRRHHHSITRQIEFDVLSYLSGEKDIPRENHWASQVDHPPA